MLYNEDCIAGMSRLPEGTVDLAFADPPFNIGYEYDVYEDELEAERYLDWCRAWIGQVARVLKPDGTFWLAIGDEFAAELKLVAQRECGLHCRSWVVWYYTFGVNCKTKFSRSHAHLFYFVKDAQRFTFNQDEVRVPSARQLVYGDRRAHPTGRLPDDTWILRPQDIPQSFGQDEDTWYFPRVAGTFKERKGWHGCQMPEQLLGRIIRACSRPGEMVLDPFAGSGTTLAVAKKLGRQFVGFELSRQYAEQVERRLAADQSRRSAGWRARAAGERAGNGEWSASRGRYAGSESKAPQASAALSGATVAHRADMKFAICNETFVDWPFDRAFAFARECGYTGIEIAPFTMATYANEISSAKRDAVRQQADAAGLEIIGLHWLLAKTEGFHLTTADPDVRRKTSDYLGQLARLCRDLGGRVMVLGSPQQRNLQPGVTRDRGMANAAEVIQAALPALEENDVVLAVEPLGPAEGDFLLTAAEGAELVSMVGSAHCRLHLDCKAMSSESAPIPDIIHANRHYLEHFHANDPNRQGPGFGDLDLVPILAALGEIDYRGWVSVEVFDYSPGVERLARESIEYLQRCLAECAGDTA